MSMSFISPKTDFAFKKIFGAEESKDILISFLNAIIYQERPVIQDLEIINPYNAGALAYLKDSYLDVKALLDNNTKVIIEMQVVNKGSFGKRIVYNLAKTYGNQLKSGEGYSKLAPVIALTITDFQLFEELDDVITFWTFKEEKKSVKYLEEEIRMVFVELPKFKQKLEELETITDKWIYFIKETPSLNSIPSTMESVPAIVHALTIANQSNLSMEELEELHQREVFFEDQQNVIVKAKLEGKIEEGINFVRLLLEKRFNSSEAVRELLPKLSQEQLEELGMAIFDFNTMEDVVNFIQQYL